MKTRSELREIIITILYQVNLFDEADIEYDVSKLIKEQLEIENEFVFNCVNGIIENRKNITKLANKYLKTWNMSRLNKVDQAIISLGIYELMYTDTPPVVCINEAVELSKKFSDEAMTKMINGVLDSIYHDEEK